MWTRLRMRSVGIPLESLPNSCCQSNPEPASQAASSQAASSQSASSQSASSQAASHCVRAAPSQLLCRPLGITRSSHLRSTATSRYCRHFGMLPHDLRTKTSSWSRSSEPWTGSLCVYVCVPMCGGQRLTSLSFSTLRFEQSLLLSLTLVND